MDLPVISHARLFFTVIVIVKFVIFLCICCSVFFGISVDPSVERFIIIDVVFLGIGYFFEVKLLNVEVLEFGLN